MRTTIGEVVVEWDANKDKINLKKHRLSFETASLVFADSHRIEIYDYKHSTKEDRYIVIGMVNKLITVVYTERTKALRIISARIANEAERRGEHIMTRIIKKTIHPGDQPTKPQINEIEEASKYPIVADDESPEYTYEELIEMAELAKKKREETKKEPITLRVSATTLKKAKATGKGYTGFLSRLLDNAINNKDLVSRSL